MRGTIIHISFPAWLLWIFIPLTFMTGLGIGVVAKAIIGG